MARHDEPEGTVPRALDASIHGDASARPLAAIRDQERALAQEIVAAQERANTRIAEARASAAALQAQAERDGVREAETLYHDGMARARSEADALRATGEADAARLRQAGEARLSEAADYIIRFVLPRVVRNEPSSQCHHAAAPQSNPIISTDRRKHGQ